MEIDTSYTNVPNSPTVGRTTQRHFTLRQLVDYFPKSSGLYIPDLCSLVLWEHKLPAIFVSQNAQGDYILMGDYTHNVVYTARECLQNGDKFLARRIGKYTISAIVIEPTHQSDFVIDMYKAIGLI